MAIHQWRGPPAVSLVLELARALKDTKVLPGISALDTIFADLQLDPVVHGIQMYEATDLLLRRRPLHNDVPAVIWQIGPLETALHSQRSPHALNDSPASSSTSRALLSCGTRVAAIYCSPHPIVPPHILRFAIEDMGDHAAEIHTGFMLYIPPSAGRPVVDRELATQLYSIEHLGKITL